MNSKNTQERPVALVTGAARRIGAALVEALHQRGYQVVLHYHHSEKEAFQLRDACNKIRPDSVVALAVDLALPETLDDFFDGVVAWGGRLDLLINNASWFTRSDLMQVQPSVYQRLYAINVLAPWHLSVRAYPWLKKTQGNIINITDIHAEKPLKHYSEYCQTKAALWMQTKSLAREFAPAVRVNAIAPGAILWPEGNNSLSPVVQQQILTTTPLRQHGEPQYITQALWAFLDNPFVTGQVLRVDGGRSIT